MFKENFECVAVHRGDAWACVILESSEFFWKYRFQIQVYDRILDIYYCQMMSLMYLISTRMYLEQHMLCNRDFSQRLPSWCHVKRRLRNRFVSRARVAQPDIARNVFWFDLQCYIDAIRVIMPCFVEEEGGSTPIGSRWCQNRRWTTLDPSWSH